MFQKKSLLIALATMSVFTFAHAQEEGGPPPPDSGVQGVAMPTGGRGGQRGMRGPGGPGGMGGPMMLMSPEVQKELNLTSDQISKIKALMPKRGQGGPRGGGQGGPQGFGPGGPGGPEGGPGGPGGRGPEGFGGPGGPEGGPGGPGGPGRGPNEMDQKLKGLLTEQQFTRMKQLRLQMEGPGAVLHPEIAKELGLSQSQRNQIEALHPQGMGGRRGGPGGPGGPGVFGEQGGPGGPGGGPGDEGTPPPNFNGGGMPPMQGEGGPGGPGGRMSKEMRDKQDAKILAILTPAQKLKWQSMLGKPFHFSPRPPMGSGQPR